MTQQNTPPKKAFSLTTDDNYRATILTLCKTAYQQATTRKEFTTMIEALENLTTTISDYPNLDQTFIHGAALALLATGRWNQ